MSTFGRIKYLGAPARPITSDGSSLRKNYQIVERSWFLWTSLFQDCKDKADQRMERRTLHKLVFNFYKYINSIHLSIH